MEIKTIQEALKAVSGQTKERKFSQTYDLIVTLKGLNLKNPDEQVDFFATMPHSTGKKKKICALVGPEMVEKAQEVCDETITQASFDKYKDKKALKKVANTYDYFIAQADIMPKVAAAFGRALGPRGKMPNPKAGCILPPKAPVQPIYERLQKTVHFVAKKQLAVQVSVGREGMPEKELAENIKNAYDQLIHHLPAEQNNVRNVFIKLTMGQPVKIN